MTIITPFQIYLIGIASSVQSTLNAVTIMLGFVSLGLLTTALISYIISADSNVSRSGQEKAARLSTSFFRWFRNVVIAFGIVWAGYTITPSTKLLATMFVVPVIVNNPTVQKLPTDLVNYASQWLKDHTPTSSKGAPSNTKP